MLIKSSNWLSKLPLKEKKSWFQALNSWKCLFLIQFHHFILYSWRSPRCFREKTHQRYLRHKTHFKIWRFPSHLRLLASSMGNLLQWVKMQFCARYLGSLENTLVFINHKSSYDLQYQENDFVKMSQSISNVTEKLIDMGILTICFLNVTE